MRNTEKPEICINIVYTLCMYTYMYTHTRARARARARARFQRQDVKNS